MEKMMKVEDDNRYVEDAVEKITFDDNKKKKISIKIMIKKNTTTILDDKVAIDELVTKKGINDCT